MHRLNQTIFSFHRFRQYYYYYCVLVTLMAQAHTAAKTNSTICTKSTHESHRMERGKKLSSLWRFPMIGSWTPSSWYVADRSAFVHRLQSQFSLSRTGRLWRVRAAQIADVSRVRRNEAKFLVSGLALLIRASKGTSIIIGHQPLVRRYLENCFVIEEKIERNWDFLNSYRNLFQNI